MTREEALERVEEYLTSRIHIEYHYEEVKEIIKALEQEPCEDAISRQAVTDTTICYGISCNECSFNTCEDGQPGCLLKERVDKLPSVTPQPKTGHWIDRFPAKECKCSVCDFLICISNGSYIDMVGQMKYCPNCGAKMVEPQESEEV